jgi:hypothetical protein
VSDSTDNSFLKLTTANKTVIGHNNENLSIFVEYEASEKPNFTWFDSKNELIFYNSSHFKNSFQSFFYNVNITSDKIQLHIYYIQFHDTGNFTLKAETCELSENISVEVIVKGKVKSRK